MTEPEMPEEIWVRRDQEYGDYFEFVVAGSDDVATKYLRADKSDEKDLEIAQLKAKAITPEIMILGNAEFLKASQHPILRGANVFKSIPGWLVDFIIGNIDNPLPPDSKYIQAADKWLGKDREIERLQQRLEKAEAVIDRMLSHAKVLVNSSEDSWSVCRGSDIIACARDYLSGVKGER